MVEEAGLVSVDCPICGSSVKRELFHTRDYKQNISQEEFTVSRCSSCTAGYLSRRPSESEIPRYYDDHFYWSFENDANARSSPEALLLARKAQLQAKAVWLADLPPGRLLDIGTMKGEFIYHMQQIGWRSEGIEFSSKPPNPFNMPIRYGDFLEMKDLPEDHYDCITLWAVLEHIYKPAEYVARIARLLKPGGRLIFLVTNFNTVQARLFEMDDYPRHLNLFTKRSARFLLERNGLRLVRVATDQSVFGGHLQGGLVYLVKRIFGYSRADALIEWKSDKSLVPFFHQWRGRSSRMMRLLAFVDRILLSPIESLFDRCGLGFTLTVVAEKPQAGKPSTASASHPPTKMPSV